MTYLCVPIFVTDAASARRDMALAAEAGADIVELRIDRLEAVEILKPILREKSVPVIVTCRPTWEGGLCEADDLQRIVRLAQATEMGSDFIDLELKTTQRQSAELRLADRPPELRTRLIVSSHDFAGRPDRLYNILSEMQQIPAQINKIAWAARTIRDNLEAFELLQHRARPTIALCMGEAGLLSRVLAKKFGAFLTFASLDAVSGTAPGQVTISDMKKLYRWDAISPETKVYGVVANPVKHSMSPAIHNAAFEAVGFDGVYLPMLVESSYESFKAFVESFVNFSGLDLAGLSITIPHKENALRYLRENGSDVEELAGRIGAVNTIAIDRSASRVTMRGSNTDYAAIVDSITSAMKIDRAGLADLRVAVLGAGGTGRTAVAALAHFGATVLVTNRTQDRAAALAGEFSGKRGKVTAVSMEDLRKSSSDVLINTTSVGMFPLVDENPLGEGTLPPTGKMIVFDTVYNPMKTKLLAQVEKAGAKTIGGVEMFVRQAAAQFETWTGKSAPREVMRGVIEKRLA